MKNLISIFHLFLFPFLFLIHFLSTGNSNNNHKQKYEKQNRLLLFSLLISSFFSLQLSADGLIGKYYNNTTFTAPVVLTRVDSTIDFPWGGGSPDTSINSENFSVEWTGYIYFPEEADYTFELMHDDDMTLTIDGTVIYTYNTWSSNHWRSSATVHYTSGYYPITLTLIEKYGGARAHLAWRNNASITSRTIVPTTNLFSSPPFTSPVAEYRMDKCAWDGSANEVTDSEGSIHGTSYNGANTYTGTTDRRVCNSGYFDGTDDYVSMGDSFNNIFGNTNDTFTITAWIKPETLNNIQSNHKTANTFIAKASDSKNDNLEIGITTGGELHLYLDTSGEDTQADFGSGITTGSWHFIAVTYDGNDVTVTIDNTTTTDGQWSGNMDQAAGSPFTIGTTLHSDTSFNGLVDEVKIYNSVLSTTEIKRIYTNENTHHSYTGNSRTCPLCTHPPTNIVLDNNTINENNSIGDLIGSFTTTDPDDPTGTGTYVYTLVSGDTSSFTIDGNQLKANAIFDYETTAIYNIRVRTTDTDGNFFEKDFIIRIIDVVELPPLIATPNTYSTTPGVSIGGNLITDNTGNGSDSGTNIVALTTATNGPSQGTVVINTDGTFTYTPSNSAAGSDTFTYTISNGTTTASAVVTINIGTQYGNRHPFDLINPDYTRNIRGNYKIAGNTVLCLTEKRSGYGGTCTNDLMHTSNNYVSKYIDIDDNNPDNDHTGTWNSSSSYIELPDTYDQRGGYGILWAGLFWQGRVPAANDEDIHYPIDNGSSYTFEEIGDGTHHASVNLEAIGANKIKLKIDSGTYQNIMAKTLYKYGASYGAYADVTEKLQGSNLGKGIHNFTVANLMTAEGREHSPGVLGGWSLVVIYAEDFNGQPRNISVRTGSK